VREFIGAHGLDQLAGVQRDSAGLGDHWEAIMGWSLDYGFE
jgi:hypothetical protein